MDCHSYAECLDRKLHMCQLTCECSRSAAVGTRTLVGCCTIMHMIHRASREDGDHIGMAVEAKHHDGYCKERIKAPIEELDIAEVPTLRCNLRAADDHHYCCVYEANHLHPNPRGVTVMLTTFTDSTIDRWKHAAEQEPDFYSCLMIMQPGHGFAGYYKATSALQSAVCV